MRSSIGFHTIELYMPLFKHKFTLLKHFYNYSQKTKLIKIICTTKNGEKIPYTPLIDNTRLFTYIIKYHEKHTGLEWKIASSIDYNGFSTDYLHVKINPKLLGHTIDYITAANLYDLNIAIINFNREARRISPLLKYLSFIWLSKS